MALDRRRITNIENLAEIIYYTFFSHVTDNNGNTLIFGITNQGDELCLEWWCGKKKLSIYLEDDGTLPYFFRIPVYNDPSCIIVEGDITSLDDAIACWNWLLED